MRLLDFVLYVHTVNCIGISEDFWLAGLHNRFN